MWGQPPSAVLANLLARYLSEAFASALLSCQHRVTGTCNQRASRGRPSPRLSKTKRSRAGLRYIRGNPKILGDFAQLLISCPEKCRRIDKDRGDQVRVNQADAAAVQPSSFNREPDLIHLRRPDLW